MATDFSYLTKEELLALVVEQGRLLTDQRRAIQQLKQRVAALEEQIKGRRGGGGGMPGNKPADTHRQEHTEERQPRAEGFGRQRSAATNHVDHALAACPECGTGLQGGWVQRTREVLEVVLPPACVVEHRFWARTCPNCNRRCVAPATLTGVTVGKQRLGIGVLSLIANLRIVGRQPLASIQWLLEAGYGLHLSVGGIVGALHTVARQATPAVTALRDRIRGSAVVNGDETGWREDGKNGYVWSFSTPTEQYFVRGRRTKAMVDEVLGADFSGVLVTDFYAAYDHYAGLHQRCWVHLLRDIHDQLRLYPEDAALTQWAKQVRAVYDRGRAVTTTNLEVRHQEQRRLSDDLLTVCRPYLTDPAAPQRTLCRRIARYQGELLTFVGHPAVPADNNAAERTLRPLVTQRKISGGTRSAHGTDTTMTLNSLFGTWRLQALNPLIACRNLLASPQH